MVVVNVAPLVDSAILFPSAAYILPKNSLVGLEVVEFVRPVTCVSEPIAISISEPVAVTVSITVTIGFRELVDIVVTVAIAFGVGVALVFGFELALAVSTTSGRTVLL